MKDPKTPAQLEREIAYFQMLLRRLTSVDRRKRARVSLTVRERQLVLARRVRAERPA